MTGNDIRQRFLQFFAERGHTIVPSSSLIPDDPSVLFTTAGMQQFKPYYAKLDPGTTIHLSIGKPVGKNAASVQKCFRTSDIDEVGNESHLTFFEMLGNFSFGGPDASGKVGAGYFKEKAIAYGHEFIMKEMGLTIDKVSVFDPAKVSADDWRKGVPLDEDSIRLWGKYGARIERAGVENFWGPTGSEGPCGPTTEIYVKTAEGKSIEIWNIVFNEYYAEALGGGVDPVRGPRPRRGSRLRRLASNGVDTGMGLERLAMVAQNVPTIFETDLFLPLMRLLPATMEVRTRRIFTDHIRGIAFLLSDGVRPSNKEAGYVLRRLMRRVMVHLHLAGNPVAPEHLFEEVFEHYEKFYPELNREAVLGVFSEERERFQATLQKGLRELARVPTLDVHSAFMLFESFGLPYEIIKELGGDKARGLKREDFDEEFKKHQEISRAGQEKKFGGHGLVLNTGELKAGDPEELKKVTRLHTATHLLQQALREVLGPEVAQRGSDITVERTRFDFSFPRKLTPDEVKEVEAIVNEKVKEDLPVGFEEMSKDEAAKTGALYFFKEKYPERVKVYYVGHSLEGAWSKEFCGGPHVGHTGGIGRFSIIKEEAVGSGVRRIRAKVE